mgnify:CR=1 FL=1
MTDTWREIGDGYAVSIDGRVRGSRGWVLTPRRHTSGYLFVSRGEDEDNAQVDAKASELEQLAAEGAALQPPAPEDPAAMVDPAAAPIPPQQPQI